MKYSLLLIATLLLVTCFYCVTRAEDADKKEKSEDVKADSDAGGSADVAEENGVLVLTTDNFDEVINSRDFILVEFYAPWCGHCKSLAPEFEAAAVKLKSSTPPVALGKVDATIETALASRFEVSGYPTLKWFKNGSPQDYEGPRDQDGIVQYMKERTDPSWKPPPEEVVVLTQSNFDEVIEREPLTLVMFYAPWCGHCKKFAPEYNKAATELKKSKKEVVLAKVDATQESELASKYKVEGYPTMKLFRKGKEYKYTSDARDKWSLMSYIEGQLGDASRELKTLDEFQKHLTSSPDLPVHIVGFFNSQNDPLLNLYTDAANELRDDYKFVHTFSAAAREQHHIPENSVVVFLSERFHTKHEPVKHFITLAADTKVDKIVKFIEEHNLPLIGEYSQSTKDKLYRSRRPLVLFFYTVDWTFEHRQATQKWRKTFADVAHKFRDYATFAIADEDSNADLFKQFGFDESAEEINVGILDDKDKRYPLSPAMEEYDADDVISFINKFKKGRASGIKTIRHIADMSSLCGHAWRNSLTSVYGENGQLKPKIKSAPSPKNQKKGAPYVVVGDTFEKIVLDNKKDVLIELYAPWCGHCKQLEPTYAKLAKKLQSDKNLVIAKMDATANDVPAGYEAAGFPTIYFAPAGKKSSPVKFEGGERTVESLEKFIRENAAASAGKAKKDEL